jgi:hypothetical protein
VAKKHSKADKDGLWISESYSLKGLNAERVYEKRPHGSTKSNRFLELADVALGVKRHEKKKDARVGTRTHDTLKKEPYSR